MEATKERELAAWVASKMNDACSAALSDYFEFDRREADITLRDPEQWTLDLSPTPLNETVDLETLAAGDLVNGWERDFDPRTADETQLTMCSFVSKHDALADSARVDVVLDASGRPVLWDLTAD